MSLAFDLKCISFSSLIALIIAALYNVLITTIRQTEFQNHKLVPFMAKVDQFFTDDSYRDGPFLLLLQRFPTLYHLLCRALQWYSCSSCGYLLLVTPCSTRRMNEKSVLEF
mmetsp:Transcript_28449/g.69020  ORF Transcript_28449/g.69020 Transcript_28449/m.69020 type:complete len:111 (+) Transcript_28449:452-784(+)